MFMFAAIQKNLNIVLGSNNNKKILTEQKNQFILSVQNHALHNLCVIYKTTSNQQVLQQ